MPPNGPDEWRARIGHWENRKLRWYQAHCGSRPRFPLDLHLKRVISEAPLLCVLLVLRLAGKVATGVCKTGNGALFSPGKLNRCHACVRLGRVWTTPLSLSLFLALSLLLLVAGDVETNPGPIGDKLLAKVDDSQLTEADALDVYCEVVGLAERWSNVCLALRLHPSDRSKIRVTHLGNPEECLHKVIMIWLQRGYNYQRYGPPSWKMLVKAVGDPAGGNDVCLAEAIAMRHTGSVELLGVFSSKPDPDPREKHHFSREFAIMLSGVTNLLDESVDIAMLKDFLYCFSHPLYPEQLYVNPKTYRDVNTTKQLIKSLCPQFINFLHYFLLEDIVGKFGCDRAKKLLQQYTDQKYSRERKLNSLPDPITDEEIEQFHGSKKLKVEVRGDTSDTTIEIIDELHKALEKASGIKRAFITYAFYGPGSVLTFLIPEAIIHIFHEINTEDLAVLADSGVMELRIDEVVIDDIQQYSTVERSGINLEIAVGSGESTKTTGLQYYLSQRAAEMSSHRYLHLLKMLGTAETKILTEICSEEFLRSFVNDLQDWKKIAPYFNVREWEVKKLVRRYPDEDDQKYQALLCWKRAEGSTATYYNLLESLILHGNIGEVEALLLRLGEGSVVLHASRWLKQQYLAHDSWQEWREIPNLTQFDQRLGKLTPQACEQLKNMDYSNCYYDIQDEFPSSVIPVSVKSLVNACTSSDHPWSSKSCILIKGAPGQGKSFLISKLCQYWASGYGMRSIILIFWIDCSRFQNRTMTLNFLLSELLPFETQNISSWIMNKQGKGVVFILDGYDQQQSVGVFHNLASRMFLPKSVVLIASTCTPNQNNVKQLELLNLTDNQISKQVVEFFRFRPQKVEDFYLFLANNPDVRVLTSIPVYLHTLLFVYSEPFDFPSHELSVTWTELFTNMILLLLPSTFLKLAHNETPLASISQPPSTVQSFVRELSSLAFENLTNRCFQLTLPVARSAGYKSGFALVHPYRKPLCHSEEQWFQFSSPLLQHFLAALHVHTLPQAKQTELLFQKSELNFIWQFFAGLLVSESYDKFRILRDVFHWEKMKINCVYEADWSCDMPSGFRDQILTPSDISHFAVTGYKFTALNFKRCCFGRTALFQLTRQMHVLGQSGQQSFRVSFEDCSFSSEGFWSLAAAPFQSLRFRGLSTEDLCNFAMGLKCSWVKGPKCLDLKGNAIEDSGITALACALTWNQSLITLDLQENRIGDSGATALANALRVNSSLKTLNLYHSTLTGTGAIALAKALQHSNSLEILNLDWDKYQWTGIGDEGATALADPRVIKNFKTLDLESNQIGDSGTTALADTLRVNQSLITLDLHRNNLTATGAIALARALQHNKSLEELNLGLNGIGAFGATALADALNVNHSLKTLNLHRNNLTATGAIALARALQHNKSLEELNLKRNEVGDSGIIPLADALRVNQSLKKLDLGLNGIGASGATALTVALRVNQSLKTLILKYNKIGAYGATVLPDALRVNLSLKMLDLEGNRIEDSGATAVADALRVNHSLKTLNLGLNGIGASGVTTLADALRVNQTLKILDLGLNKIGASGATALADALRVNQSLKILDLRRNGIGDFGATALADTLTLNQSLEILDLYQNQLTDVGVVALARSLQLNESLAKLNLNQNGLTSAGAINLVKALQCNTSLKELSLDWDQFMWSRIGDEGVTALADLRVLKKFKTLNLSNNGIKSRGSVALASALKECRNLERLYLGKNKFQDEGCIALCGGLQECRELQVLHFNDNNLTDASVSPLTELIKTAKSLRILDLFHNHFTSWGEVQLKQAAKERDPDFIIYGV